MQVKYDDSLGLCHPSTCRTQIRLGLGAHLTDVSVPSSSGHENPSQVRRFGSLSISKVIWFTVTACTSLAISAHDSGDASLRRPRHTREIEDRKRIGFQAQVSTYRIVFMRTYRGKTTTTGRSSACFFHKPVADEPRLDRSFTVLRMEIGFPDTTPWLSFVGLKGQIPKSLGQGGV